MTSQFRGLCPLKIFQSSYQVFVGGVAKNIQKLAAYVYQI